MLQLSLGRIHSMFSPLGFSSMITRFATLSNDPLKASKAQKSIHYMDLEKKYGCHNYAPLPIVVEKAKGVFLWDVQGKRYFDFLAAYSAVNQGHCHPRLIQAVKDQIERVTLTSRAVYNNKLGPIEQKMTTLFGYEKVLLMNTGVEAGESAIKLARRWGYVKKGLKKDTATVLFAKGNFWGRTLAACASSDDPDRFRDFGPFNGLNFKLIDYGCIESLKKALQEDPSIVAYFVEPIQGEKGVVVPPAGYLQKTHQLLKAHNALLICDEVQTGLGRTGSLLCSSHDKVRPDIVLLGKALSGGLYPVSAVLCDDFIMGNIKPGEHGSTYGGNPLASHLAATALDIIIDEKLCENSTKMGALLHQRFTRLMEPGVGSSLVREIRGKGLFIGIEFISDRVAYAFSHKLLEKGLVAKPTQKTVIRFAPPLCITQSELSEASEIIEAAWKQIEAQK